MPLNAGTVVFPLQNTQGTCAAYAQLWLAQSLQGGAPVRTPSSISWQQLMRTARAIAGKPAPSSLVGNGLKIDGPAAALGNLTWMRAFWRLALAGAGYYYLTIRIKVPPPDDYFHHAMACRIEPGGAVLFLEAEDGLMGFAGAGPFVTGAAPWYARRMRVPACDEFGIYPVALAAHHGTTGAAALVSAGLGHAASRAP